MTVWFKPPPYEQSPTEGWTGDFEKWFLEQFGVPNESMHDMHVVVVVLGKAFRDGWARAAHSPSYDGGMFHYVKWFHQKIGELGSILSQERRLQYVALRSAFIAGWKANKQKS